MILVVSWSLVLCISLNTPFRLYYDFSWELGYLPLMWWPSSYPLLYADNVFFIIFLQFSSNDGTSSFSSQIFYSRTQSHVAQRLYTIVQVLSQSRNSTHLTKPRNFHYSVQRSRPLTIILMNPVPSNYLRNILILLSPLYIGLQSFKVVS